MHLVSDDYRGSWFVTDALRRAGIPILELQADNVDERTYDRQGVHGVVVDWLENEVLPHVRGPADDLRHDP